MLNTVLSESASNLKIRRIATQIMERNYKDESFYLVGVRETGYQLSLLIAKNIESDFGISIPVFPLRLEKQNPSIDTIQCELNEVQVKDKVVVVVDDVQNTGRTLLYVYAYLLNFKPSSIQSAVLIDRRHNSYPVKADFIGLSLATMLNEHVEVVETSSGFKAVLS
jgi:pyrimidine operon attenuation protein/uracil phosphoribosyltransferase